MNDKSAGRSTSGDQPQKTARRAAAMEKRARGVRGLNSIPRPLPDGGEFDLHYIRSVPSDRQAEKASGAVPAPGPVPIVIIPGGPGLASAVPYDGLRARMRKRGLETVMVEMRGIGLSRRDRTGADLPLEAMRMTEVVADLAAVLDAEGIEQAVIAGSSFGTYVAQAFAVDHPERVAGLLLDSAMMGGNEDALALRQTRALLYHGTAGDEQTRRLAHKVADLASRPGADERVLGRRVRILWEFCGPQVLDAYLNQAAHGWTRLTDRALDQAGEAELTEDGLPFNMEMGLVGELAFRELPWYSAGDGGIFDEGPDFEELRGKFSDFAGESYDLPAAWGGFDFPVIVLSGDRDTRTPRLVAERIVDAVTHSLLVPLPDHGHSALDLHSEPFIAAAEHLAEGAAVAGTAEAGAAEAGSSGRLHRHLPHGPGHVVEALRSRVDELAAMRKRGGPTLLLAPMLRGMLAADRLLRR